MLFSRCTHYFSFRLTLFIFCLCLAHHQRGFGNVEITIYPSRLEEHVPLGKNIDSDFLQSIQQMSATEALKHIPGVTTTSLGSYGSQSYLKVRGNNPEHTKVRIWGVEMNDASGGGRFDFSNIFTEDMQALTVHPTSDLSSIGGTVEIEPRKGSSRPEMLLSGEGGSYLTGRTRAELSGAAGSRHYFIGGTLLRSGTGRLENPLRGNTVSDRHFTESLNARVGHQLNDMWEADLYVSHNKSRFDINRIMNGLPFRSPDQGSHEQGIILLKNHFQAPRNHWEHDLILDSVNHCNESSVYSTSSTNRSYSVGAIYNTKIRIDDSHQISACLGTSQDRVRLSTSDARSIKATNVELGYKTDILPKILFEGKGRLDRHDFFKTHGTYLVRAKTSITSDLSLFGSYGTSFRAPTAFDFFSSGSLSMGNPRLKPMTSRNFEIGSEVNPLNNVSLGISYFHLDIKDLLVTAITPHGQFQRINADRLTEGLETFFRFRPNPNLQIRIGYTLTHALDKETRDSSVRVPSHQFTMSVRGSCSENTRLFVEGFYRSSCKDHVFLDNRQERVTLPSSLTIRMGGAYQFNDRIELSGRIENLLDDHHEDIYGYPNRGFSFFLGVNVKHKF